MPLPDYLNPKNVAQKYEDSRPPEITPSALDLALNTGDQSCIITSPDEPIFVSQNYDILNRIRLRLLNFCPPILLGKYVQQGTMRAHKDTLHGIDFVPQDYDKLIKAFRNARAFGDKAFHEGSKAYLSNGDPRIASYGATNGVGFREMFIPKTDEIPVLDSQSVNFMFIDDLKMDISCLHAAITPNNCNIHIDNVTVIIRGLNNQSFLSPTAIHHLVNELLWKTIIGDHLPNGIVDHLDLNYANVMNGAEKFSLSKLGVKFNYKVKNITFGIGISIPLPVNKSNALKWAGTYKTVESMVSNPSLSKAAEIGTSLVKEIQPTASITFNW